MISLDLNDKSIRSYKTRANLEAGLKKIGLDKFRHLIVCTEDGRFTAIFPQSSLTNNDICYLGYFAQYGFMTLG